MRCEYSRTIVYHNWMHYASSLVKCIITTLLTIINHNITHFVALSCRNSCSLSCVEVVYVVSVRKHTRRARCRAWFFPVWGVEVGVRVRLLSGWEGFMGGWFLKGRQR